MTQHSCPFCDYPLLRHIRPGKLYWFCRHCYHEVPVVEELVHVRAKVENTAGSMIYQQAAKGLQPQTEQRLEKTDRVQRDFRIGFHKLGTALIGVEEI